MEGFGLIVFGVLFDIVQRTSSAPKASSSRVRPGQRPEVGGTRTTLTASRLIDIASARVFYIATRRGASLGTFRTFYSLQQG
ncbi:hypothetical protein [Novipirellula caenicola]|uniref:Secreted protein n=1 Tax=Novipirellula caenicola TaxID=1536901 RepID=A0ABP9VUK1_9BACT